MPGFLAEQLWKSENGWIRSALKVSATYQVPPTFLLFPNKSDQTEWTHQDKKLVLAHQLLQDESCGKCGTPVWLGHTEHSGVDFEIDTPVCYSCQVLDKFDHSKAEKGSHPMTVPVPSDEDGGLPGRIEGMMAVPSSEDRRKLNAAKGY